MSEEKKYLLTTGQLGKVMAYVLASNQGVEEAELLANFILNSNEYHERTCHNISDVPEYEFKCSECLAVQDLLNEMSCLNLTLADRKTEIPISYCPHCGLRVVEE